MTELVRFHRFRRRYLALTIGLMMLPTAYAMQELSDHSLSDTTGEGVALVLDNFKMVMQAPNDISSASSYNKYMMPIKPGANASQEDINRYNEANLNYYNKASQYDTGFIRLIPTGENYQQLSDRAFDNVYQPAYQAQYQSSYNTLKNEEYLRVYQTEYNAAFQQKRAQYEQRFRDAEYQNTSGTLYKQRYDHWYDYHSIGGGGRFIAVLSQRREEANRQARNDLDNVQQWKDALTTKVNNKLNEPANQTAIGNEARPIAETNSNNLATQYAQNNAQQHTNQQIRGDINSATDMSNRKTKADVFIYGLALSKSDGSLSTRFSNQGFNWGTADNPWLIHAGTQKDVRQFSETAKDIGYIAIEAPLMSIIPTEDDNNIKFGMWMDIFARDFNSSNEVNPITGGPIGGLDANERLRLQVIANGLSLNGSQLRLFQTARDGVELEDGTFVHTNYSETLGMASLIRLNTNDTPHTLTRSSANLDAKGIRISTAARDNDSDGVGATPALNGSTAPIFNQHEGLYLYSPNINLVLGNMYQPFIVGSEDNNIILEVTRIPNVPAIYNEIYQNYGGGLGSTALKGDTCNVYQCGIPIKSNSSDLTASYQGRNATHSSITIGSSERIPGTNRLRAIETPTATGVVFKSPTGNPVNLGSAVIDGVLIQHLKIKTTGL